MILKVRLLLSLTAVAVTMSLSGCGHYVCSSGATFGGSCTSSGGGINQGGGGTTSASAFAFAVDTAGTIDGYTLDATNSVFGPTAGYTAPVIPTQDDGSGMVVAQKKYLYVGIPSTFQVFGYSVDSNGGLTALSGSPFGANYLSTAVGTKNMITNPAGTFLFVLSGVSNQIYVYQIGSSGSLSVVSGSPFTIPFLGANLAIDGLGKYLYITQNLGSHTGLQVAAYSISSSGGLTAVQGSPFAYPMWEVAADPTGKYLIGTTGSTLSVNGTDDFHLYVFSIQQSGSNAGALTQVSGSPFTTVYSPYGIAMQPNSTGNLVYSFSINDTDTGYNAVEGFSLDSTTGSLTALSLSPFSGISDGFWGQIDQSGAYLFVYGGVLNNGTVTADLGAMNIGTGGALTEPTSQLTLPTSGFWTVTDPQ
jgi:6-phosphogluconolactonase (cycloisomerase 2 family)